MHRDSNLAPLVDRSTVVDSMLVPLKLFEYSNINFYRDSYGNRIILGNELTGIYYGTISENGIESKVVVKELPQHVSDKIINQFQTEVNILRRIRHPNIIELYGICVDRGNPKNLSEREPFFCLVMEFAPNGSLHELIHNPRNNSQPLTITLIGKILKQIAKVFVYLHHHDPVIIHRDLKPEKILFDVNSDIKLIGFELAMVTNYFEYPHGRGTIRWMAPEQFKANPTTQSEIYSFGIIIWELFSRQLPYPEANEMQVVMYKQNPDYKFIFPQNIPPELKSLAERCLNFNPESRPSIDTILRELDEIFPNIPSNRDE